DGAQDAFDGEIVHGADPLTRRRAAGGAQPPGCRSSSAVPGHRAPGHRTPGREGRAVSVGRIGRMFGINGFEMIILVIVALFVIGPQRLPEYAGKLRDFVRSFRRMAEGAKETVKQDFGADLDAYDWRSLDPRQYDPRRIVREALAEEDRAIREERLRTGGSGT